MQFTYAALTAAALFAGTSAEASSALIYEPFSQTPGALSGATASTGGLTGTWSDDSNGVIQSESLSYGNLQHTGNQATADDTNARSSSASIDGSLGSAGLLNDGATVWFSLMFSGGSGGNEHTGFALGTDAVVPNFDGVRLNGATSGTGDGVGFYKRGGTISAAVWIDGGKEESKTSAITGYKAGDSVFVVGKIIWGNDTNQDPGDDDHQITIFQGDTSNLGLEPTGGGTASVAHFDQSALDTISFGTRDLGSGIQTITFDEIRFGATYESVSPSSVAIPSPSALGGGLAMLGLIAARRRRKA